MAEKGAKVDAAAVGTEVEVTEVEVTEVEDPSAEVVVDVNNVEDAVLPVVS